MAATLKLVFFIVLALTSSEFGEIEAAHTKISRQERRHVDCSKDENCDPFGKKIDWKCKNERVCQEKCNSFGGVFTCTYHPGYCFCQAQT